MRLLHTSDWHLGRTLHRADLLAHQAAFVDALVATVREERVDVVLLAGDVFDRAVPPVEAVRLYDEALFALTAAGAKVVVTSGNHDSATRLGAGSRLIDRAGVFVRTDPRTVGQPVLLEDTHGPVAVHGLPYLEPEAVRGLLPPDPGGDLEEPRGHRGVLGRAMACVRADLITRQVRSVVLAHAWVTGGEPSDSERAIGVEGSVGGVGHVPASLFDGVDYTALGHLHGRQVLREGLRYSGSPLAYSFSEAAHVKGSWLLELDASGLASVELVPAPVPRRLSTLRGTLAELLTSPAHTGVEDHWLSVVLTDALHPEAAMDRLRTRFPHALLMSWEPEGVAADERSYGARVARRSDLEVAQEFVRHVRAAGEEGCADEQESALLAEALEAGRLAEVEAAPADGRAA